MRFNLADNVMTGKVVRPGILLALLCIGLQVKAQFGAGVRYSSIQQNYWEDVFASIESDYSNQLASAYLLYWFRLKQKRVEFMPVLGYGVSVDPKQDVYSNTLSMVFAQFNTDIYFLDFGGDCNCPTFSKQGNLIKRGVFAEIAPGVEFRKLSVDEADQINNGKTWKFHETVPSLYTGLGLDIGISDFVTVTPTAGAGFHFGTAWDNLEETVDDVPAIKDARRQNADLSIQFGLRILLRPDYVRGRR